MLQRVERKKSQKILSLQSEVLLVTPEIARAWLDQNTENRKRSPSVVSAYARDMKAGKWPMTGDAIRFDKDGQLIDGQHRLAACIEAETPFPSLVIYNLEKSVQLQIDSGKGRKSYDVLTLMGYHYAARLAAAARLLILIKQGALQSGGGKLTHSEIVNMIKRHPALPHSVAAAEKTLGVSSSLLAAVHFIGARALNKERRADAFLEVWKTGVPDYDGDPAQKLRERMLRTATSRQEIRRAEVSRLVVHSWNAFAKRRPLDLVRSPKDASFEGLDVDRL